MAETPTGTVKVPENAELVNLQERETVFTDKIDKLEAMDANAAARQNFDLAEAKRRVKEQLAEVRKEIQRLKK